MQRVQSVHAQSHVSGNLLPAEWSRAELPVYGSCERCASADVSQLSSFPFVHLLVLLYSRSFRVLLHLSLSSVSLSRSLFLSLAREQCVFIANHTNLLYSRLVRVSTAITQVYRTWVISRCGTSPTGAGRDPRHDERARTDDREEVDRRKRRGAILWAGGQI